jgi:hypothetical protein
VNQTISVAINPDTTSKPNETFSVSLTGGKGAAIATASGLGTIVDTIGAPPAPPVAGTIATETLAGTAITLNVLASATDPNGYALSLASFTQGSHGTVAKNASGMLVYTPVAGYLGADSFMYTVTDTQGLTATGTVSMLVIAAPAAGNWPAHVLAPYVDMTLFPTYNLVTAMQTAGLRYFTLPVLPTGLTADGLYVLQSALKYGVKISTVNVMAMDFGDSAAPNPSGQMGAYAIDSAQSTFTQLRMLYGTTLSTSQLWGMVGVTPMIGVNDQSDEVFGFSDAKQLLAFAENKN